ncbi:MAG: hypothetical protein ACREMD_06275 [Gemmatimonadota bacterium]
MIDGLASASVLQTLIVAILAAAVGAGLSALGLVLLTRSGMQRTAAHVVFWETKRYERHADAAIEAAGKSDRYKATQTQEEGPLRSEDVVGAVLFRNRPSLSSSFQQASAELLATDPELALRGDARQAVLGEEIEPKGSWDMLAAMTEPKGLRLPEILAKYDAKGWLAEGLTRLYLLEGLIPLFGGYFQRLEVGPATASSLRLEAEFVPSGQDLKVAAIRGIIPLP